MDTIDKRINAFHKLGELFKDISIQSKNSVQQEWVNRFNQEIETANQYNKWFTKEYLLLSFQNWSKELNKKNLCLWIDNYSLKDCSKKTIAIIMAGNLPMVGFHDFICSTILNYKCLIKLSSDDKIILPVIIEFLDYLNPGFNNKIEFTEKPIKNFDGVIATGSNSSFKYFEYYFKKYPKILRKNRHSIAILDGNESKQDLINLGKDVFYYFGMGCRSVSKLLVPNDYNFDLLFNAFYEFKETINHNRYANNYDYNKAIYLMSEQKFIENGFIMLKEDEKLGSPISCLFYEKYNSKNDVNKYINSNKDVIQCVVGNFLTEKSTPFGSSQSPKINDFADNIDTLNFLLKI